MFPVQPAAAESVEAANWYSARACPEPEHAVTRMHDRRACSPFAATCETRPVPDAQLGGPASSRDQALRTLISTLPPVVKIRRRACFVGQHQRFA